jgi:iron complex transport system substrate-binding protein
VVLGQEDDLANVLALGVKPVAAGANVPDQGFQGVDEFDTEGVEPLDLLSIDAEDILLLEPYKVVTSTFFAEEAGQAVLDQLGDVFVLDDHAPPADQMRALGAELGREDEAEEVVADLEAAQAEAEEALSCLEVSVAAVYPGPSVAAFVDGPAVVSGTLVQAGATLVPDEQQARPDQMGRNYLSRELVDVLGAPQMILLQSDLVEGEADALAEMEADAIWRDLPAVKAGKVTVLDRLGYPGVPGRIRVVADLIEALT